MSKCKIIEKEAKGIITKSKLPDADYVVNPYTGCEFGCLYCYASFMGRFVNEPFSEWGNYVYVKSNAVELFHTDYDRLRGQLQDCTLLLSSVTDPYQGVERKYQLTRGIIQHLVDQNFQGKLSILTKSIMVTRDIDLLTQLNDVEVGFTLTTTDDKISRDLELRATGISHRLRAARKIHDAGIKTYAFVGPLLPHFLLDLSKLDELFKSISEIGIKEVFVEYMNMSKYIKNRLNNFKSGDKIIDDLYKNDRTKEEKSILNKEVHKMLKKHGLCLRLNELIDHAKSST